MTSANVTYYQLWVGDKYIGEERQNCMCKTTIMQRLAMYQPVERYDIMAR